MWQFNKSEIQISHSAIFLKSVSQYLTLCHEILEINDQVLIYLPYVQHPSKQTFQKLFQIQVNNRESRDLKAIHLAAAYFSTSDSQRQKLLKDKFISFLNKLRIVPPKIRVLLELQQLVRKIKQSIRITDTFKNIKNKLEDKYSLTQLNKIISPNQIIEKCSQMSLILKKLQQSSLKFQKQSKSQSFEKYQQFQFFDVQKEFKLDNNLKKLLLWRCEACKIISLVKLQKQCKQNSIKFIKQTKSLMKITLLNIQQVVEIYTFCLKNICNKQNSIQTIEGYVYFKLELQKILSKFKNQLSTPTIQKVQKVMKKIKQITEKSVLKKYAQNNDEQIKILQKSKSKGLSYFRQKQGKNSQVSQFLTTQQKSKTNLNLRKQSSSSFTHRSFLATNRFSMSSLPKKINAKTFIESQSLNKIKQYQLSLRKKRQQQQNDKGKTFKSRLQLINSVHSKSGNQKDSQIIKAQIQKNKKNANYSQYQDSKIATNLDADNKKQKNSKNSKFKIKHDKTTNSRFLPFTQRLYQSLRQKNPNQLEITSMNLQNEIIMIPEILFQKPKITFEQITRDIRFISQMQNQSESSTVGNVSNQILLSKIEVKVSSILILNGGDCFTLQMVKSKDEVQKIKCFLRKNQQFVTKIKFDSMEQAMSLKNAKSTVEGTDLFFELMQNQIKILRPEATTKFLIMTFKLEELERIDNQTYLSYYNIFNSISIIANYIKPYVYWYWTYKSKMNGYTIGKRQKLEMSDPLKFSINLQSFKKNDFEGCVQMFKTVRNKKGLKECLNYLSEDRQILCRYLVKNQKGNIIVEIVQLESKYVRNFQISQSNQLTFPVLKLAIKRYGLDEEYKNKHALLIQRAFEKLFMSCENKKTLKKKSNQTFSQQTQDAQFSDSESRINMKKILNNSECNSVIINNLNKNFISPRLILKLIKGLKQIKNPQDQDENIIRKQLILNGEQKKQFKIYLVDTQENNLQEKIVQYDELKNIYEGNDLNDALRNYIVNIIGTDTKESKREFMDKVRTENRKNTKKLSRKMSNNQFQLITNTYSKQKYNIQYILNSKIMNFWSFLIAMSESYDQSMMFLITKTKIKKVKVNKKFYQLAIHCFLNQCYFIILRDNNSQKQWIMYATQRIIKLLDSLIAIKSKQTSKQKLQTNQQQQVRIQRESSFSSDQNKSHEQHSQKSSIIEHSKQNSLGLTKNRFIPQRKFSSNLLQIFNSQSQNFQLRILKTPYNNKLTIHKRSTGKYFINRIPSKSNKWSIVVNWINVLNKKVLKTKSFFPKNKKNYGTHLYMALSFDTKFYYYRLDIYLPYTQQKYVSYIVKDLFKFMIEKSNQKQILSTLIDEKILRIDLKNQKIQINQSSFKLFKTFGQLTLPQSDIQKEKQKIESKEISLQKSIKSLIKHSGLFELLKYGEKITLLLLDYQNNLMLISQLQDDPQDFFTNLYAECPYKQTKNTIYQNLLRRTYQKVQKNTASLFQTTIINLSVIQ